MQVFGDMTTPLVEREAELGALVRCLAAAAGGEGSLVLVEGETGIGRSELLAAGEELAHDRRMVTLVARGNELERDFPFGVVLQLLERTLLALPRRDRDALLDGPAALAASLFPALRGAGSGPDRAEDPFAVVHGVYWLFARLADQIPLALIVDDAQWIDERSLQVLRYLAARVSDLQVMVLVAAAPERSRDGSALDVLARASTPVRLALGPLSPSGVARVVRSEFPDAEAGFCDGCATATAGVPLLLHELLAAVRTGRLPPTAATAARLGRLGTHEVAEAVLRRLQAMPAGTTTFARMAAVLGDDAELRHVADLAGLDLRSAAVALEVLYATGIAEPDETVRFRHPIVRAALEASLPAAARANAHLRLAQLLLGEAAPPERVAGHLLAAECGGRSWVVEVLRRAAERAVTDGAPASAARYLERALREPPDDSVRAELLLALARVERVRRFGRGAPPPVTPPQQGGAPPYR